MIKPQEWADWLRHPVTETVLQHLNERKDSLIGELLNLDRASHTIESYGTAALAIRYHLDGLGEILDLDDIQETVLAKVSHEN